jgi:hypothetical protein
MSRECQKPRNPRRDTLIAEAGREFRPPERDRPSIGSVHAVGSGRSMGTECVKLRLNISEGRELLSLVNSGADISLVRTETLGNAQTSDPENKIKVKTVNGSVIETLGTVESVICEEGFMIPCEFHQVNRQVDIPNDGILGRDFLEHAGAQICFQTGTLTMGAGDVRVH